MLRLLIFAFAFGLFSLARANDVPFRIVDTKGAPVPDAVVSLHPVDKTSGVSVPRRGSPPVVEIVQDEEQFQPYVTPVLVGTKVDFPNRDTIKHHVYSSPKKFELPLYAGEAKEPVVFDQPGVFALGCNIHDTMLAYVVVLETPLFAKTDATGAATIRDVPIGSYRAEVWQPRLGASVTRPVLVGPTTIAPLEFKLTLRRDPRIRRDDAGRSGYK